MGAVSGEETAAEADFTVLIGVATPLAGGRGLGLMAGACALAGAVAIRRKEQAIHGSAKVIRVIRLPFCWTERR